MASLSSSSPPPAPQASLSTSLSSPVQASTSSSSEREFKDSSSSEQVREFKVLVKSLIGKDESKTSSINSWNETDIVPSNWKPVFELAKKLSVRSFCLDECWNLMSELTPKITSEILNGENLVFKKRENIKDLDRLIEKGADPYKAIQDLAALRIIGYNIDEFENIGIKVLEHIKSKNGSVYKPLRANYGNRDNDLMYRLFVYTPNSTIHEVQILHPFADWVFTYNSVNRSIPNKENLYKPMKIPYVQFGKVKRQREGINLENCSIYDAMKLSIQTRNSTVAKEAKSRYMQHINNLGGTIPEKIDGNTNIKEKKQYF